MIIHSLVHFVISRYLLLIGSIYGCGAVERLQIILFDSQIITNVFAKVM